MSKLNRKSDLESTFTKGPARKDLFFGDFFVYNAIKGGSQIICVEKLFNEEESVKREIEAKKKRILNKHEYLVNLLDYSVEEQRNWCSTFYLLKCFYEYVDRNLIGEILDRKRLTGDKNQFKMEELTHLMYQQVYANAFLQERGVAHGDISPNTLFVSPKNEFKLAFRMNDQMTPERVQVDKAIKNEPLYLAPAFYEAVKQRTLDKLKHSQHKSDMFALGLTILQGGLMRGIQDIYVGDRFDARKLEEFLMEFEGKYEDNPLLYTSIRKMCEISEEERPDFISLKSALPEYDVIKDYFQKVEAGIYEEETGDEQAANDSLRNYEVNYHYDAEQWLGQQQTPGDSQHYDDGQGGYQNQQYLAGGQGNQQAFGAFGTGPHANFSRSISNKLSNSSNQNSQNNSFNKAAGFNGEFDAHHQHQGHQEEGHQYQQPQQYQQQPNWAPQQNTTNLKQGSNRVDPKQPAYNQQQGYGQSRDEYASPPAPANYSAQMQQRAPQQPQGFGYGYDAHQQVQSPPAPQPVYNQPPPQQAYAQPPEAPKQRNKIIEAPKDDYFANDFFNYKPPVAANSGYTSTNYSYSQDNSVAFSTATNQLNAAQQQPARQTVSLGADKHFSDQPIHYQEVDGYYFPEVDEPAAPAQPQFVQQQPSHTQSLPQQPSHRAYQSPPVTPANSYQTHQAQAYNVAAEPQRRVSQPQAGNGFSGNTRVFDGKVYNEIREESSVMENGVMIKKTVLRYVQADAPQPVQHPVVAQPNGYYAGGYSAAQPTVVQYR